MNIPQAAPRNSRTRVSSESAWPLRGVDGLTFAERAAQTTRPYSSPIPIRKDKVR
jgi:hypothetical protein